MNIYVDFENKKIYSEKTLYQEADRRAAEFEKTHKNILENFLFNEEYCSYHEYNTDTELNNLRQNTIKFEVDV